MLHYHNVEEAAEMLDYTAETVRRKIRDGVLPAVKRGRRYYVHNADLWKILEPVD